ncbi:hypothetical protein AC1031_003663 [Aphanomyces cochlioides]|nr:hypothetical protein AC1031_003663 [Aphanomyces cochlioides]
MLLVWSNEAGVTACATDQPLAFIALVQPPSPATSPRIADAATIEDVIPIETRNRAKPGLEFHAWAVKSHAWLNIQLAIHSDQKYVGCFQHVLGDCIRTDGFHTGCLC